MRGVNSYIITQRVVVVVYYTERERENRERETRKRDRETEEGTSHSFTTSELFLRVRILSFYYSLARIITPLLAINNACSLITFRFILV